MYSVQLVVGQKVICVSDMPISPSLRTDEAIPRKGSVYTVREIVPLNTLGADDDGLLVAEIVNPPRLYVTPVGPIRSELAFQVARFRPAPDIGVFKRMFEQAEPKTIQAAPTACLPSPSPA
jgi:hypothetical protein